MYGFIGNLFDESCRGNDHAAALAGMSAATRSEAGRCLQRLLVNMQVRTDGTSTLFYVMYCMFWYIYKLHAICAHAQHANF